MAWIPFQYGQTLGQRGSELGTIILDEECDAGARITLEEPRRRVLGPARPFSVTCGVYGLLVHTRFFGTEDEAREHYAAMKARLEEIASLPADDDHAADAARQFISDFP